MEEMSFSDVRCLIHYPKGFSEDRKYPLLLLFNGAGSRGDAINVIANGLFFRTAAQSENFPFVVVAPLCTENTWFDMWERLMGMVKQTAALPFVDRERMYMLGASMGGYATWQMAMSMPEYFAAIVPICGGGM